MVAAVNMIYICPKCDNPISSMNKPVKCPSCSFKFSKDGDILSTKLEWLKSPSRQLFEIIQQETEKAIPKESKELLPKMTKEQQDSIMLSTKQKYKLIKLKWERKRDEFFFNTDADEVEELVQCIYYLMNRSISSGNRELITKCAVWARKFSEINTYLEPFLKNGGDTYERTDKTSASGDSK